MSVVAATDDTASIAALISSAAVTVVLGAALAYAIARSKKVAQTTAQTNPQTKAADAAQTEVDTAEFPGGKLTVYYATQTGTAEAFARELEREAAEHGFYACVADLEDVALEDLISENTTARAIFVTSTYGEGEAPDNATQFVHALEEQVIMTVVQLNQNKNGVELNEEPEHVLAGLEYTVFGLGNKQYDHYNSMGKFFDYAIARLGGERVVDLGLGDDDADLEGDFETWKETKLWPALKKRYISRDADTEFKRRRNMMNLDSKADCPYVITYHDNSTTVEAETLPLDKVHGSSRHYFTAVDVPVSAVRELQSKSSQRSTVHVEVDISSVNGLTYETADNLGVLPLNKPEVVESVAKSLGYDLDKIFSIQSAPNHEWKGAMYPMPLSVRECLMRYCDLTGPLRRSDLKVFAAYANLPTDQKALLRWASKDGKTEFKEKIQDGYIGLVDLLKRCPSINMPLEHFLNVVPMIQTRFFTISSSSSVHPNSIHMTVAVNKTTRPNGTTFEGVCSNYLAGCKPSESVIRVYNRASTFRLPKITSTPIILIGPGTGIAPMRALLQERQYQRLTLKQPVGRNILYFGCKKEDEDYLYENEFKALQESGDLHELHVAFSRAQNEKVYVQHLLRAQEAATWKLVDAEGAFIYICGAVKMGGDVAETLRQIIATQGQMSSDQAKDYLTKMSAEGRFVQELWA